MTFDASPPFRSLHPTLLALLEQHSTERRFTRGDRISRIADALAHVHAMGVVHRDLKPDIPGRGEVAGPGATARDPSRVFGARRFGFLRA